MSRFVLLLALLVLGTSAKSTLTTKSSLRSLLLAKSNPLLWAEGLCAPIDSVEDFSGILSTFNTKEAQLGCAIRDKDKEQNADKSYATNTAKLTKEAGNILNPVEAATGAVKLTAQQVVAATRKTMKIATGNCPWAPNVYGPKIAEHAIISGKAIVSLGKVTNQFLDIIAGLLRGVFGGIIDSATQCFNKLSEVLMNVVTPLERTVAKVQIKDEVGPEKFADGQARPAIPKQGLGAITEILKPIQDVIKSATDAAEACAGTVAALVKLIAKITSLIATAGLSFPAPKLECWFWHWVHRANQAIAYKPAQPENCPKMEKETDCVKYASCQGMCEWKSNKCSPVAGFEKPTGNCPFSYGFFMGKAIGVLTEVEPV